MSSAIGPYTVVSIDPPPARHGEQFDVISRSGVDGLSIWDTGERGAPFTVTTKAKAVSHADAQATLEAYNDLRKQGPQQITYAGRVLPDVAFHVLNVQPKACKQLVLGVSAAGNFYGWVEAEWTLLPVDD